MVRTAWVVWDNGLSEACAHGSRSVLANEELLRAFGVRSDTRTVWQVGLWSNVQLCVIVVASFALQLAIHHLPALQTLFGTSPISLGQCAAWVALGSIPLLVLELRKILRHSRAVRQAV